MFSLKNKIRTKVQKSVFLKKFVRVGTLMEAQKFAMHNKNKVKTSTGKVVFTLF